jgi:hypothetical protein
LFLKRKYSNRQQRRELWRHNNSNATVLAVPRIFELHRDHGGRAFARMPLRLATASRDAASVTALDL